MFEALSRFLGKLGSCQNLLTVQLTAVLWDEKSSSKLNRVIYDFKLASNKVKYSKKLLLTLLLDQHHFQYNFSSFLWVMPLAWSMKIWFPPKNSSPASQNFQMIATTGSKSLKSFKAMPTFLKEILRHQILTSCCTICDVITPSIEIMWSWNLANLLFFIERTCW